MSEIFVPGWNPEISQAGINNFFSSGGSYYGGPMFADDNRPLPAGFSLSRLIKWNYDQGPVGSCFANMMAIIHQLMQGALKFNGYDGEVFNPSRRLIWHQCRKLDGSLGSRQAGGSIINSFAAVGQGPQGIGVCDESMWPYKPDHWYLEQTPPSNVVAEAGNHQLLQIADIKNDTESWKRSVFNGKPVGIGIWWPQGWDRGAVDQYGRTTGIGPGEYGHAVAIIGWINNWDGHTYYEIQNSHGPIYTTPVPQSVASNIIGYKHTGFAFWAREDLLLKVMNYGHFEACIGAGVEGFVMNPLADYMLLG